MSKFQRNNELERVAALKSYQILDTLDEAEYDRLTKLASIICQVPISLVSLIDDDRQWIKSRYGLDAYETEREVAFCQHAILDEKLFTVPDAHLDDRFKNNPYVTEDPNIRFYAGYPLVDPNGFALGTLCVIDRVPRVLTEEQQNALRLLSEEVMSLIVERRQKIELKNFEKLFNISSDLICIVGNDGYFKKINPAFAEKLGKKEEYLLSTPIYDLLHPNDVERTKDEMRKLKSGLNTLNFSNRFMVDESNFIHLQWVATPEEGTGLLFAIARDVTSEKIKEEKILISENKFRTFFENSQGLMCTHDLEGNFITVNSAGAALLGYTVDEVTKMNLKDIIPSKYHDELKYYLHEVTTKGSSAGQMVTRHKNGNPHIWMYSNILAVDDQNQKYIIGNSIDTTEQYFLQVDLNKSKERLEQTNKLARVGAWEINLVTRDVYWSDIAKIIHEVPLDFVPTIENTLSFYTGDNTSIMTEVIEHAMKNGSAYDIEIQITTQTRKEKWVRIQGNTEMYEGNCIRLFGAFQDIDDRKKAELEIRQSRKLFDDVLTSAVEVSIISTDKNGIITLFNAGAEEMLGYSAAEMVGKNSPAIIHDEQEMINRSNELSKQYGEEIKGFDVFTYLARKNGADKFEWTYIHKNGNKIIVSLVVSPIFDVDNDNEIIGYIGIATDITNEKKQNEELKKAKILAEEASIAKSKFLANMSHEIRTPLNGVIGFTDLILKTELDDTQEQYISIVNQSANSLLGIINDILDFSKIEAGKLELDIDKCDLFEISSQATDIITFQAHSKGLEVLLNISNTLPRFIYADIVRLKQIIVNLLGNAVKFTEQGEIELQVKLLEKTENDFALLRFQVKDTGIGIHPDKLEKIFEAFAQEDSSTTKKYGGTGLGLTISNKLLGLMGSKLQLSSTLGEGSTFFFDIKLKVEYGDAISWDNENNIKSVLIVDDNDNNRMILRQMLSLNKISSTEATNGIEAIKILSEKNKFDVIIMDYHMPYMDGIETIKKIRENFQASPELQPIILLYSSSDDEKILKACEEYKVNYRLVKPIKMNDLFHAFSQLKNKNSKKKIEHVDKTISDESTLKILIAEDNTVNMLLSKTLVKKSLPNANILEAKNGVEAVSIFEKEKPSLVFMDIQMPEMNGYEATKQIRSIEENSQTKTPIIALTAGNVKGEKEKCLELGMDDFIVKPINQNAINEVLKKWLTSEGDSSNTSKMENATHFNINTIRELVDNNEEMVEELLTQLKIELHNYKLEINSLNKKIDLAKCKSLGHKLYGMASSVGMITLADFSRDLELKELDNSSAKKMLQEIVEEIDLVLGLV